MGQIIIDDLVLEVTRKKVKNINLRVRTDGSVAVSAPKLCSMASIEAFVRSKKDWIINAQNHVAALPLVECLVDPKVALAYFTEISDEIFPLFADVLNGEKPVIKVRKMKTRWGVCVPSKKQITFSLQLYDKPRAAIEYVVLHEYAHFVRADHSPYFWAVVNKFMPDYKMRKKLLKSQ